MSAPIVGRVFACAVAAGLCVGCSALGGSPPGGGPGSTVVPGIGMTTELSEQFTGCGDLDSPWGAGSVEIHRGHDFDCAEALAMTRQYFTALLERQYSDNTGLVHLADYDVYCSAYGADAGYRVSCVDLVNEVLFVR